MPLDMADVEKVADRIAGEGIRSVAISLLHSYANPEHEARIADVLRSRLPDVDLSVSSQVLPEMREYERTSTTVINAYVRPVVATYLGRLADEMRDLGITVPLTIMQSNGGLMPAAMAAERPIYCIESGPAAGVVGAYHLGKRLGEDNIITFDMGGTTAKASIIEDGEMISAPEYEVGGGMSVGHRLLKGSGYILRVPAIDLAEVSAGGGSIAWVDKAGALQCGPQSAGAVPGPACYDGGGEDPTVTDANVVLGYLNPVHLLGGAFPIDADKARRAIADKVGRPLQLDEVEAAYGVHMLVNSNMGRALRAVSSERGRDPRRFTLVAFGGGGPVHSAGLAEMLSISRIIVPVSPGVFSAFGLLFADVEHHFVQTHLKAFAELDTQQADRILQGLREQVQHLLSQEGFGDSQQRLINQMDVKYVGQTSELTVNMSGQRFSASEIEDIGESYAREHEKTYGYRVDEPLQLVNIRVIARGLSERQRIPDVLELHERGSSVSAPDRRVYFGPRLGWIETPVIQRPDLAGGGMEGALAVVEYDSTTIVPPKWRADPDAFMNVVMQKVT